jgi:hypothetical protein
MIDLSQRADECNKYLKPLVSMRLAFSRPRGSDRIWAKIHDDTTAQPGLSSSGCRLDFHFVENCDKSPAALWRGRLWYRQTLWGKRPSRPTDQRLEAGFSFLENYDQPSAADSAARGDYRRNCEEPAGREL